MYADEGTLERHHGTVENAICAGNRVPVNDRIVAVPPDDLVAVSWPILPWEKRNGVTYRDSGYGLGLLLGPMSAGRRVEAVCRSTPVDLC